LAQYYRAFFLYAYPFPQQLIQRELDLSSYINNYFIPLGPLSSRWQEHFSDDYLEIRFSEPKQHKLTYKSAWVRPLFLYGLPGIHITAKIMRTVYQCTNKEF
jgi:hypothetical protein